MVSDQVYVMLSELVEAEGVKGSIHALKNVIRDYADEMSDLGLKELAIEAADVVDILDDVLAG